MQTLALRGAWRSMLKTPLITPLSCLSTCTGPHCPAKSDFKPLDLMTSVSMANFHTLRLRTLRFLALSPVYSPYYFPLMPPKDPSMPCQRLSLRNVFWFFKQAWSCPCLEQPPGSNCGLSVNKSQRPQAAPTPTVKRESRFLLGPKHRIDL